MKYLEQFQKNCDYLRMCENILRHQKKLLLSMTARKDKMRPFCYKQRRSVTAKQIYKRQSQCRFFLYDSDIEVAMLFIPTTLLHNQPIKLHFPSTSLLPSLSSPSLPFLSWHDSGILIYIPHLPLVTDTGAFRSLKLSMYCSGVRR